jgi:acyl-CoA dehydrogenase
MDPGDPKRTTELMERLSAFMDEHIYPSEARLEQEVAHGDRCSRSR